MFRGEKEINAIAAEYEIVSNQIRNWKTEFLKNASAAFVDKVIDNPCLTLWIH